MTVAMVLVAYAAGLGILGAPLLARASTRDPSVPTQAA